MSDANQVRVSYAKESTYGTAPTGSYQIVRQTGETLRMDTGTTNSAEIRSDRQIADVVRNSFVGAGDLNIEFPYGAHDDLLEYVLQSAVWTTEDDNLEAANTVSVDGANVYTIDAGAWSTTPTVGDWLEIRGFATAINNGYKKVTAADGTTITTDGAATTIEGTVTSTIDQLGHIKNGTTFSSLSWEKNFLDLSNKYMLVTGFSPNTFNLTVATGSIITGSFGFVGQGVSTPTSDTGSGYVAAGTNSVNNAIDHIESILVDGVAYSATQLSVSLTNNLRTREQIATLGPISLGSGTIGATGTLQAYFTDETEIDKYHAGTTGEVAFVVEDTAGNGYIIDMPQIRYTSGQVVASGINTDTLVDIGFTAYLDSTTSQTIRISRFTA
jgi:hypothetical protein